MTQLDNLHYDFSRIDGYDRDFNYVISPRECGKTTAFFVRKSDWAFQNSKAPTIIFRRYVTDITDAYISGIEDLLNKFKEKPVHFKFKEGQKKEGVIDLFNNGVRNYRIIALNQPISRIKSLFLKEAKYIFMDEFICNIRLGEKYLKEEPFKMKEIYNTFQRESPRLKSYFLGNPYSLYNPYFADLKIDTAELKPGKIITGADWAVERAVLNPVLAQHIKEKNPLYKFEADEYERYAVQGEAINDQNIRVLPTQPSDFSLDLIFKSGDKYIGIYRNNNLSEDLDYWAGYLTNVGSRRDVICFDFQDLEKQSRLFSRDDRTRFSHLRVAIGNRRIAFQSLECDYIVEDIYSQL